jgi:L-iditol 2-dehydrogenase
VDVQAPVPHPDQSLVAVKHIAICGTDMHLCSIKRSVDEYAELPLGFSGHECVAHVIDCPSGSLLPGQPVLVIGDDTFAEQYVIGSEWLLPLPEHIPMQYAVLTQLLGTVLYACKRIGSVIGQDVVVLGQGPAGLLFTRVLQQLGARQVICTDIVQSRLEASSHMGASYTINASKVNVPDVVKDVTLGKMADLVIEASGDNSARNQALDCIRWRGTIHCFGLPENDILPFDFGKFFEKQPMLMCTGKTAAEPGLLSFKLAIQMVAQGLIDVSNLVTHCLDLSEINRGFELAKSRTDGALKILLSP